MKTRSGRSMACLLLAVAVAVVSVSAPAQESLSPVRMDPEKIAGLNLTSVPNDAYIDILVAGTLEFNVATLFDGEELHVSIFESTPATTDHRTRPLDVDEFVLVLSGKLILKEQNGRVQEFTPGQMAVLPVGYDGTWEMQGNYRELAITAK
jgi:uncharacterized cupin superfamily protein